MAASLESKSLAVGLVSGVLLAFVLAGGLPIGGQGGGTGGAGGPVYSTSSGTGCYDGTTGETGWAHVVANGETWATTLNATVVHPAGTTVDVEITRREDGAYEVELRTVEATGNASKGENCRRATRLDVAAALSEPSLVVTIDGRTVRSIDQDVTTAVLYRLPRPINATA